MYASGENTTGNVPAFLMKVWTLVEDPATDELIYWDPNGTSFHVFDQQRFSREILPLYFKHSNIASFIRQLNMYGFRKVTHIDQGGLKIENDDLHFQHSCFQRGEKELLQHIKRKVSSQSVRSDALTAVKNDEVSRVLTDVNQIKSKQQDTDQNLEYIKRENKLLWREIAALRQKHHKQQEIVNKLIQFLVSLVSSNRSGLTIPSLRRAPLAIDSSQVIASTPVLSANTSSVGGEQLMAGIPQNYTIQSPKVGDVVTLTSPSASGPIIHELSASSPVYIASPESNFLNLDCSAPNGTAGVSGTKIEVEENPSPMLIVQASGDASSVARSIPLSPKIEQAPTLEDALLFDWTVDPMASSEPNFLSPTAALSTPTSQGRGSNQKRKRSKPAGNLTMPDSSPAKRASGGTSPSNTSADSLMTPDILSTDQANSTLDQLVMSSSNMQSRIGGEAARSAGSGLGTRDATLALSASNGGDDVSLSSSSLDLLSSDLDGLRGLLQEQYRLDPTVLMDLFESSSPWPILSDKPPEEDSGIRQEEPSTSGENDGAIIGTEVVQYNPKELFPDLLEDGMMGDIDDID